MDSLTREPVDLTTRAAIPSLGDGRRCACWCVAGIGYAIWFWPAGSGGQAARNRNANQPIPVLVATAEQQDVPIYLDGLGTVQAFYTVTVKPMVDGPLVAVNFKEGQDVQEGRRAGADRSAHLPGGARPGGGEEGAGRGAAGQRAARPRALRTSWWRTTTPPRQQADTREVAGGAARGAGAAGPGADRHRADPAGLHHDRLADRRPDRHAAGRCRQHRACVGYHRAGGDHPVAADLGGVHACRSRRCRPVAKAMRQGSREGAGLRAGRRPAARAGCWIPAR